MVTLSLDRRKQRGRCIFSLMVEIKRAVASTESDMQRSSFLYIRRRQQVVPFFFFLTRDRETGGARYYYRG